MSVRGSLRARATEQLRYRALVVLVGLQACGGTVSDVQVESCRAPLAVLDTVPPHSLREVYAALSDAPSLCDDDLRDRKWRLRAWGAAEATELWEDSEPLGSGRAMRVHWRRLAPDSAFRFHAVDSGVIVVRAPTLWAFARAMRSSESMDAEAPIVICSHGCGWIGERRDGMNVIWSRMQFDRIAPNDQRLIADRLNRTAHPRVEAVRP
jgi:hypothetical protein